MIKNEVDLLRDVSQRLQSAGIQFMVTGSMAMSFYAQPRMTRDIDLVVALNPEDAQKIIELFVNDYYLEPASVKRAISRRSIFNLIHDKTSSKVDFIVLKSEPFRQEEFSRRRALTVAGFETWIVSREDLILSKLYWAKDSRSEMQLKDVRNLLSENCDAEYLRSRAQTLGVSDLLEEVIESRE